MGCGKSTVGRKCAERCGFGFVDTDAAIVEREQRTITELFKAKGEEYFRRCESDVIASLPKERDMIVATGGGAPCFGNNMDTMLQTGTVVYISLTPANLARRLARGRAKRPKIAAMNDSELLDYIATELARREEQYCRANSTICCDGVDDNYVVDHLLTLIDHLKDYQHR